MTHEAIDHSGGYDVIAEDLTPAASHNLENRACQVQRRPTLWVLLTGYIVLGRACRAIAAP